MPACSRCGEENDERARFCWACGAALAPERRDAAEARKTVTVVFSDVAGSTSLGEQQDPEQLRRVMSRYFEGMRSVLESHGGTVEKFIGDAVMAVFGIPRLHEDDALRAVRAAADMREALVVLNDELEGLFGIRIEARTGVNSGEVIAGDPSRGHSFVTGDAVNAAERLQRTAAPGEILIGEETYRLARDAIRAEPVGPVRLKGKEESLPAYRLLEVSRDAPARRFTSPMVGRGRERMLVVNAFDHAVRERACHLFTVLGAAGVGKSRLVSEVLQEIGSKARVLTGSCLSYGEGITFWPVIEVVKQATGVGEDDTPKDARAKIEARLGGEEGAPLVAERVAEVMGLAESGGGATEESFWAVRRLLEALARERPLVVVFDDINWAEPTFLDLIEHIADWSRDAPILLVCTARPELLDVRPTWGGGKLNATSILLEPLTEIESDRLMQNLLGEAALAPEFRSRVLAAAEGNPLFVEEMLAMLIDDGLLRRDDGRWLPSADLSEIPIPRTITVLLASRLDRLDTEERRVVERAAVEGKVFHRGAVEALSSPDEVEGVGASLMALVRKELIRPDPPSFAGEDAFRFRHILIREAAYESVPKEIRAVLHERLAAWLERAAGGRVVEYEELLGYHLEQTFRYRAELARIDEDMRSLARRAGNRLASAGRRALGRDDIPAARKLLERGARLFDAIDERRPDVLLDLGVVVHESGDLTGADIVLGRAVEDARATGNAVLEARGLVERAALRQWTDPAADIDELVSVVERAMPVLEAGGDDLGLSQAWRRIAQAHWWRCRFAAMEEVLDRALVHAERARDEREISQILNMLCRAAALGPRPVNEAIERCAAIRERAQGDPQLEGWVDSMLAILEAMSGRYEEARDNYVRSRRVFEALGLTVTLAAAHMYFGIAELIVGDAVAAERELLSGYVALDRIGERAALSTMAGYLARALYMQDRYEDAERFASVSREAATTDDLVSQVEWRGTMARVSARRGEESGAEELGREAVALSQMTDFLPLQADAVSDLAEALLLLGRHDEASAWLDEAIRIHEAKGDIASAARTRALLTGAGMARPT